MNTLERYLQETGSNMVQVMNRLQNHTVISDNAAMPEDVAEGDAVRAVAWLKANAERGTGSAEREKPGTQFGLGDFAAAFDQVNPKP